MVGKSLYALSFLSDVCCLLINCSPSSTVTPGRDMSYRVDQKGSERGDGEAKIGLGKDNPETLDI